MPPAARKGDQVAGSGQHTVTNTDSGATTPTPVTLTGSINNQSVPSVLIEGSEAATSTSAATISHTPPMPPPGNFTVAPPVVGTGQVGAGSATVFIGGKAAARLGDEVGGTCACTLSAVKITSGATTVEIGG